MISVLALLFACMLFCRLLIFSKSTLSKNSFGNTIRESVKQFGSRSGPTFVGPDLGLNCLQRFSADDTSRQRVNELCCGYLLELPLHNFEL